MMMMKLTMIMKMTTLRMDTWTVRTWWTVLLLTKMYYMLMYAHTIVLQQLKDKITYLSKESEGN